MTRYIVGRFAAVVPVLFVVSLVAFGLDAITPGDPAFLLLQAQGGDAITPAALAQKHAELHLDDPLPTRYLHWLVSALHGDFGRSFRSYTSVAALYRDRIGNTALLAICAVLLGALVAIPLGTVAAYHRGGAIDGIAQVVAVCGSAIPGFWVAFVSIFVLSAQLHWLPVFGTPTPKGIIMPALVLSLSNIAILTRLTRSAMLDILSREFVQVARAKGLATGTIARAHILPNAVVPILTVLGLEAAHLMTGAAVVEYVFAWPGIGKLAVDAALLRDTPVIVGFAVAAGMIFVTVNLVVDLAVALVDPRVRSV